MRGVEGGPVVAASAVGPVLDGTVARRVLGYELTRLLADRAVTHGEMAERLGVSRASFTQAVSGKTLLSRASLEVALAHLGAVEVLPRLLHLLRMARRSSSRRAVGDRELVTGLEAFASRIELYDVARFGGLVGDERWRVLAGEGAPELVWLVEEHLANRRQSTSVREQVRRVLGLANVTVQVVPVGLAPELALSGGFEIVHGPAGVVVCEEARSTNHYHDSGAAVAEFRQAFTALRMAAYPPEQSRVLLADT
ncbi:Scr1 family TA system antitoxin-like transcriptional regulator [Actinokineospora guangxiensis]|uniref:Scr1 family TA system antitoxin-like transcriptional regulator n=1 Tax=Actinokineospora guangxiensis TaxID=1490288 RepID=A0ABW0ELN7_9PSEU